MPPSLSFSLILVLALLAGGVRVPGAGVAEAAAGPPPEQPRLAMLWAPAANLKKGADPTANWARHSVIVIGIDDLGLEWPAGKFPGLAETLRPEAVAGARETLDRVHKLNPAAVVLCEVYFFEDDIKNYPPDHPWWLRDRNGKKTQFWPGCHQMDLTNPDYVKHVARRIAAVHQATGPDAGIFLDNLRFEAADKAAWTSLLEQVRALCGPDLVILLNAGWDSDDLAWVCPRINGVMYEDSVAHTADKDAEAFYGRIAGFDRLLRSPRVSVNEKFGRRNDAGKMARDWIRTLVYTDMAFLYSDSTQEHAHSWAAAWDVRLGRARTPPSPPEAGKLARREFANGLVLWLPASAKGEVAVELPELMRDVLSGRVVKELSLKPDSGAVLERWQPKTER